MYAHVKLCPCLFLEHLQSDWVSLLSYLQALLSQPQHHRTNSRRLQFEGSSMIGLMFRILKVFSSKHLWGLPVPAAAHQSNLGQAEQGDRTRGGGFEGQRSGLEGGWFKSSEGLDNNPGKNPTGVFLWHLSTGFLVRACIWNIQKK